MTTLLIAPSDQVVDPGGEALFTIQVVNRTSAVDRLALDVVGPAGRWSRLEPSVVALLPGSDATATVVVAPPVGTPHGRVPVGIRVTAETTGLVEVAEANLDVGAAQTVRPGELRPTVASVPAAGAGSQAGAAGAGALRRSAEDPARQRGSRRWPILAAAALLLAVVVAGIVLLRSRDAGTAAGTLATTTVPGATIAGDAATTPGGAPSAAPGATPDPAAPGALAPGAPAPGAPGAAPSITPADGAGVAPAPVDPSTLPAPPCATSRGLITQKVAKNTPKVVIDTSQATADANGAQPTVSSVTRAPAHGTATIGADSRTITYAPAPDYVGPDAFTFTVANPSGAGSPTSMVLCVQG